jgi:SP family arabinose:H+ symporter-like MFS transporter
VTASKVAEAKRHAFKLLTTEYRWPLIIVNTLAILSSFTGSVAIRNFAPTIFERAGVTFSTALTINLIISVVNAVFVACCTLFVDNKGRCQPLRLGISCTFAGALIISAGFFGGLADSISIYLTGCLLTTIGYSVGFGTVGWILSSELFPTVIRGRALSVSTITRNISDFVTNTLLLLSVQEISAGLTFLAFAVFSLFAFTFVTVFLVETKEREPSEILVSLHQNYVESTKYCFPYGIFKVKGKRYRYFI